MSLPDLSSIELTRDILKIFIPKTAENHRSGIMRKLEIHNILELVRYAAKIGLVDMDLWIK